MNLNRILKNTFALGISQFINKLLLFIFTIFIARYLEESGFGQYSLVITLVGFFNLFTNFGLGTIAFRDVSKNYPEANKYFNNILFLRICLATVSLLVLFLTVNFLGYQKKIILATYIYGLTLFTNNIIDSFNSIFNAFEKMEYMAILTIFLNIFTLGMGIFVLRQGYGLVALVLVSAIAGILTVILSFFFARRTVSVNVSEIDFNFCRTLIKTSFPLMLLGFLGLIYFRIDIILLSKMKTDADIGLYNAAYKVMDTFMIVSNSIIGATFPHLSRYFHVSLEELGKLFRKLFILLLFLGLLVAFSVFFLSKQIIILLFGSAFSSSILALRILIWAIPLIYVNAVLLYTLIAGNRQSKIIVVVGIVTFVNLILNLLLIPKYGYIGSSYVTVLSEFLIFLGYYCLLKNKLSFI